MTNPTTTRSALASLAALALLAVLALLATPSFTAAHTPDETVDAPECDAPFRGWRCECPVDEAFEDATPPGGITTTPDYAEKTIETTAAVRVDKGWEHDQLDVTFSCAAKTPGSTCTTTARRSNMRMLSAPGACSQTLFAQEAVSALLCPDSAIDTVSTSGGYTKTTNCNVTWSFLSEEGTIEFGSVFLPWKNATLGPRVMQSSTNMVVLVATSATSVVRGPTGFGLVKLGKGSKSHVVNKADEAKDSTFEATISNTLALHKSLTIDTITIKSYDGAGSVTAYKTAPEATKEFLCGTDDPCNTEGVTVKMTAPCTSATAAGVPATVAVTFRCADDTSSSDVCDSVLAKAQEFVFIQPLTPSAGEMSCENPPLPEFAIDAVLNADDAAMLLSGDDAVVRRRYSVDPYMSNARDVPVPARFSTVELAYAAPPADDEAADMVCATAFTNPVLLVDVHGHSTFTARSELDFKYSPDVGASSDMSFSYSATAKQVDEMVRGTATPAEQKKIGAAMSAMECLRITAVYDVQDNRRLAADAAGSSIVLEPASTIIASRASIQPSVPVHVLLRVPSRDSAVMLASNHNGQRTDLESAYSTNVAMATGASITAPSQLVVSPDHSASYTMLVQPQGGADASTTEMGLMLSLKPAIEAAHASFAAKHGIAPAVVSLQVRDTDVWSEPTPGGPPGEGTGLSPLVIAAMCVGGLAVIAVVAFVVVLKKRGSKNEPAATGGAGAGAGAGAASANGVVAPEHVKPIV